MSSHDRDCTGHESLATRSLVINTVGLLNDYALHNGLQAQEIHQTVFLVRGVVWAQD